MSFSLSSSPPPGPRPCPRRCPGGWGGSRWAAVAGSGGPGEPRGGGSGPAANSRRVHMCALSQSALWRSCFTTASAQTPEFTHMARQMCLAGVQGWERKSYGGRRALGTAEREGILPRLSGIGGPAGPRGQPGARGWDVPLGSSPAMLRRTRPSRCPRLGCLCAEHAGHPGGMRVGGAARGNPRWPAFERGRPDWGPGIGCPWTWVQGCLPTQGTAGPAPLPEGVRKAGLPPRGAPPGGAAPTWILSCRRCCSATFLVSACFLARSSLMSSSPPLPSALASESSGKASIWTSSSFQQAGVGGGAKMKEERHGNHRNRRK